MADFVSRHTGTDIDAGIDNIASHLNDTNMHVSSSERSAWNTAKNSADQAYARSETALTTANQAKSTADTASTTAASAKTISETASNAASSANDKASEALSTAKDAGENARTALVNSVDAKNNADAALTTASEAMDSAEATQQVAINAKSTAEIAASDASSAKALSETAISNSETALSKAEAAQTDAAVAKTSAETALTTASNADRNAAQALIDIEDLAITSPSKYASRWNAIAAGNPIAFVPAPGSNVQVTGDTAGTVLSSGKNMLVGLMEYGSIATATGAPVVDLSAVRTIDYTPILPNTAYAISNNLGYTNAIFLYTQSKAFISYATITTNTFVTPSNAAFIRVRSSIAQTPPQNDLSIIYQLEFGGVTPIEPSFARIVAIIPNTPINIKAIEGINHLIASAGTLTVRYNRDSNDMLKQFAHEVSNTADVAQVHGLINHQPVGITARVVAGFSGPEGGPSPELRWTIAPVSQIDINAQGTNLFRAGDMKSSGLTRTGDDLSRTATPNGTYYYSQKNITGLVPYGTYTIRSDTSNSAGFVNATDIMLRTQRDGVLAAPARTVTYEKGQELIIVYYDNLSNTAAIGVTYTSYWKNIQLTLGTIAPPFEPFSGTTKSIAFAEPLYGLPNGPQDEWDALTGIITRKLKLLRLDGTGNWVRVTTGTANIYRWQYTPEVAPKPVATNASVSSMQCDTFRTVSPDETYVTATRKTGIAVNTGPTFTVFDEMHATDTLEQWRAALAEYPVYVLYERATPVYGQGPIAVFPSQGGTDTVFTNAGGPTTLTGLQGLSGALAAQQTQIDDLSEALTVLLKGGTTA